MDEEPRPRAGATHYAGQYRPIGEAKRKIHRTSNLAGYTRLADHLRDRGQSLELSRDGVRAVESMLTNLPPDEQRALSHDVAKYLGDSVCATTLGAEWEVMDGAALVRLSTKAKWDVAQYVAQNICRDNRTFLSTALDEMQRIASA